MKYCKYRLIDTINKYDKTWGGARLKQDFFIHAKRKARRPRSPIVIPNRVGTFLYLNVFNLVSLVEPLKNGDIYEGIDIYDR